ncbi:unnamed protein product [Gordionus sp. m RMFG-2023]|uniref:high mobility group protein Z-like n=1 Tax=Gordionus sp. m RMFG-2023 TaxID=3053472 RepID=UPI0030E43BA2
MKSKANKDKKNYRINPPDSEEEFKTIDRGHEVSVEDDTDEEFNNKPPKATSKSVKKGASKKVTSDSASVSNDKEKIYKKKKVSNKDKNTDMPKRPLTSYFIWLQENRERLKQENPGASITEISKFGGEGWRNTKDRSKWEQLSSLAKDEYNIIMRNYESKNPNIIITKSNKESKSKLKSGNNEVKISDESSLDD